MLSGVGFPELILIFVIGLLILGPERLPRVASQLGRWIGRARRTANQLRFQLEREIALADIDKKTPKNPPRDETPPAGKSQPGADAQGSGEPDGSGATGDTQGMAESTESSGGAEGGTTKTAAGPADAGASGETPGAAAQTEGDTAPKP